MDRNEQRQIALDLAATGKDAKRRQLTGVQALKSRVKHGANIGSLIPSVAEVLNSSEADRQTRHEACLLLAECLSNPHLREKCSVFTELQRAMWSCTSSLDEQVATIAFHALSNLASEDFVDFIEDVGLDTLTGRILDHRIPSVRAHGINYFGVAIVRAWAWVALLQCDGIRDLCLDMLRAIFARMSDRNLDPETHMSIANVLDHLMAAYLSIDPLAFAPLPLLHVAWQFGAAYATLIVELMRDLEPMLEILCEGAEKFVGPSCIWLPGKTEKGDEMKSMALEAASLRANLLWILVGAGGLARRYADSEETSSSERNGSLIWELVREGCKQKVKSRILQELSVPQVLEGLTRKTLNATPRESNSWIVRFCSCRARLMQAIVGFARAIPNAAEDLLEAARSAFQTGGKDANPLVKSFCSQVCCSVMALWPMLEYKQADPQILQRFVTSCASILLVAAISGPASCGGSIPRGVQCAGLAARALVQVLDRLANGGHPADLNQVFPQTQGRSRLVNLLCREGANVHSTALAEALLREFSAELLHDAAIKHSTPDAQAAIWRMLTLVRRADSGEHSNHAHAIAKILNGAINSDVHGSAPLLCMCVAALSDIGEAGNAAASRDRAIEAARSQQGSASSPEVSTYYKLLAEELRASTRSRHLSTVLCSTAELAIQTAFCLHGSSDHLELESVRSSLKENSKTLSGPPLMVSTQMKINWPRKKSSHVCIRADIFNVTGLSYNDVKLEMAITSHGQRQRSQIDGLWSYAEGRSRPVDHTLESLHARQSSVVWRDLHIYAIRPLCITFILSYDNTAPDVSSAPGDQTDSPKNAANADAWSEDEEEDNDELQFICHPLRLPLSVFFTPFYGFDSPAGSAFPPPLLYAACPLSMGPLPVGQFADLNTWRPTGFHRLVPPQDCLKIASDVHACYAGVAFDDESVLCFMCKASADGVEMLEIRTNSQGLLHELNPDLYYWILADSD